MAIFTAAQIAQLAKIFQDSAAWLSWTLLGTHYVTPEELNSLKASRLFPMDMQLDTIKYSFVLGKIKSLLKESEWKKFTFDQAVEAASTRLTPTDEFQIEATKLSFYSKIRGLESDIKTGLFDQIAGASKQAVTETMVREKIADIIKVGVESGKLYKEVAKDFRKTFKDKTRDWDRVATNELDTAFQNGVVATIVSKTDVYSHTEGIDSDVAIIHARENICDDCRRLYNDPKTGNPIIFKLRELLNNAGSNYIKPWRKNAKPVVVPLHPNCGGFIRHVGVGFGWDEQGKYTLLDPKKFIDSVTSKSLEGEVMNKSDPHKLLHESSGMFPTEDEIQSLTEDQIPEALKRVRAIQKLHVDDADTWDQFKDLENKLFEHSYKLSKDPGEDVDDA
jgi:hypothetical protein